MRPTAPLSVLTLLLTGGLAASLVAACSSDDKGSPTNPSDAGTDTSTVADAAAFTANAAVSGPADTHCGSTVHTTSAASCHPDASAPVEDSSAADTGSGEAGGDDAGSSDGDDTGVSDYGDTLNNAEGDDDDCKYHLKWVSSPVAQNTDVTFQVTITRKDGGSAYTGGSVDPEVFLSDTHVAPDSKPKFTELGNGVYQVSPIRFDQPGKWTVRFHIDEQCEDTLEDSPHGHVAFYVTVP